jgi:hypothetical protein
MVAHYWWGMMTTGATGGRLQQRLLEQPGADGTEVSQQHQLQQQPHMLAYWHVLYSWIYMDGICGRHHSFMGALLRIT